MSIAQFVPESLHNDFRTGYSISIGFLESADRAYCSDDYALNETFLFMYRMLWEYARDSLSPRDYLDFCKTQLTAWQELYM